jgi:hypothetical protein
VSGPQGSAADRRRALVERLDQDRTALAAVFGGLERQIAVACTATASSSVRPPWG